MDPRERIQLIEELCSFERRLSGTDAERRAANWLAERLRTIGRRAETEPIYLHPQFGLVYAAHSALGLAGSLAAIEVPVLGFALVLFAATSMNLDLNARFYLLRRLFFRRASQNVISKGANPGAPARLVLVAHYDAARTGSAYRQMHRAARLQRLLPLTATPPRILFWSLASLVPITGARMAGLDSDAISLLQLFPTLVLLVAVFAFVDIALSPVVAGANGNASGVATALSLAAACEREPLRNLDLWIVLTAGKECLMQGMREFLRTHRDELDPASTYVVNIDSVGKGELRYELAEGPAVTYELDSRLTELCNAIAEADSENGSRLEAAPLRHGFGTDALPARLRGIPATTITCLEPGTLLPAGYHLAEDIPEALDPDSIERAHAFALTLIHALDRDVGRQASKPNAAALTAA